MQSVSGITGVVLWEKAADAWWSQATSRAKATVPRLGVLIQLRVTGEMNWASLSPATVLPSYQNILQARGPILLRKRLGGKQQGRRGLHVGMRRSCRAVCMRDRGWKHRECWGTRTHWQGLWAETGVKLVQPPGCNLSHCPLLSAP